MMNDQLKIETLSKTFTDIPFNRMLGLKLETLAPDQAVMHFDMKAELIGNFLHGILHGGVISSVLDMAGGIVVMTSIVQKHSEMNINELAVLIGKCSTVDLHISYLRPGKGERFTAKAWLTKSGNKISFTRMELYNEQAKLIATGNGTYSHS